MIAIVLPWILVHVPNDERQQEQRLRTKRSRVTCTSERSPAVRIEIHFVHCNWGIFDGVIMQSLRKHAYSNILKILPPNNGIFLEKKKSDIFPISAQNIDCGYSLEPPRRGGSNEYPQSMLARRF